MEPLEAQQAELSGTVEALRTEKAALEAELTRWKARTTHLIEQCNKADPEEIKRLTWVSKENQIEDYIYN